MVCSEKFRLFIWVEPGEHVEQLPRTNISEVPEFGLQHLPDSQSSRPRWPLKQEVQFISGNGLKLWQVVVVSFTSNPHSHLPKRAYAIGVAPVIGGCDLVPANSIIDDALLTAQITEVGPHHGSKLFVLAHSLSSYAGGAKDEEE